MKSSHLPLLVIAALFLWACDARADFTLTGSQQTTVNTSSGNGWLYNQSHADVVSGGYVATLYGYNTSSVAVSGGQISTLDTHDTSTAALSGGQVSFLHVEDSSTVNVSGAYVSDLEAVNSSIANISGTGTAWILRAYSTVSLSGGLVSRFYACGTSNVSLSGGDVYYISVQNSSTVTFHGRNFSLGSGLSFSGNRILGTGDLSGQWFDGTPWVMRITENDSTATILTNTIVPEPATLSLLALGAVTLIRRRRAGK